MESLLSGLKSYSLSFVEKLSSPIGVYLRRAIFEKETKADNDLKRSLYEKIVTDQSADGSWGQLFVHTANNLWNLALLGYDAEDGSIKKGLEWLLSIQRYQYKGYPGFFLSNNKKDAQVMRATYYGEFGPGCTVFYQTAYAVHLFHIFGFDSNQQVQRAVKSYLQFWSPDWCGAWCTINVLRLLIEHPISAKSTQVERGLRFLLRRQTKMGAWRGFPFYHTLHALSRSRHVLAKKQFEKAFSLTAKRQKKDGSWGKKGQEVKTFLVLDSLNSFYTTEPNDQ